MEKALSKVSDKALHSAFVGINDLLVDLQEILNKKRFQSQEYVNLMILSNLVGNEYFRRESEKMEKMSKEGKI